MKQSIRHIALLVKDYDEAIAFYTQKLNFKLIEDTYQPEQDKRWVVVSPPGSNGVTLLLARASKPEQERLSEISREVAYFYFSIPTIFGVITRP